MLREVGSIHRHVTRGIDSDPATALRSAQDDGGEGLLPRRRTKGRVAALHDGTDAVPLPRRMTVTAAAAAAQHDGAGSCRAKRLRRELRLE